MYGCTNVRRVSLFVFVSPFVNLIVLSLVNKEFII